LAQSGEPFAHFLTYIPSKTSHALSIWMGKKVQMCVWKRDLCKCSCLLWKLFAGPYKSLKFHICSPN
jgi:hypothetical protein